MHSSEIAEANREKLLLFLMRRGLSRPDAEDVLQVMMLKAWRNCHQYRGDSTFLTWLAAIAKNEYRMSVRRFRPVVLPLDVAKGLESPAPNSYERMNREEQSRTLRTNLAMLPRDSREIVRLVYFQDKTVKEAAAALGLTTAAAKTRCWRAVNKLRAIYGSNLAKAQGRNSRCSSRYGSYPC